MKKYLVLALAALLVLSMIGCSADKGSTDAPVNTAPPVEQNGGAQQPAADPLADAANKYFAEFPGNRIVAWEDLFTLIDAGEEPFILSIRQQDVYDQGHIVGAYRASWGADLAEKVSMLPKDKPVYVYCYSGQTAGQAVALMNMLGIEAYSVKAGFNYGATKVEGYEAYVETTPHELENAGAEFDPTVLAFVQEYFKSVDANANFQTPPAEADTLSQSGDAMILDIRSAEDYAAAHIEGAVNLPYGKDMQLGFADLPKDEKIIVACYSGQTAGQTVAVMRALGFNAYSMQFGMAGAKGWTYYVKTSAANKYFAEFTENPVLPWADLLAKLDAGEALFLLDIRSADDYAAGHVKGAYSAAWGEDLAAKVAYLPKDAVVYVYCYTGQTAGQTIALMRMLGINAISVQSGFNSAVSTVEGFDAYVDTTPNELVNAGAAFDPFLLGEVQKYFNGIADNASYKMSLEDSLAAVQAGTVTVLDIRKAEDFAAGHIEGAINIPFGQGMQEKFSELPAGKLLVTCYSGQTAGQTTAVLRMLGYDAVSMHLGMKLGWIAAGYPVVTD
ncbi:MAG: rhodanese-like domain-containing protein [Clostridiaceae bacterium]|nr:rhodanese-like domain-containing protein [Eubacteriales bacterium]